MAAEEQRQDDFLRYISRKHTALQACENAFAFCFLPQIRRAKIRCSFFGFSPQFRPTEFWVVLRGKP